MSLRERWQSASARERVLVGLALAVVIFGAGYAWLWTPLQRDLAQSGSALADARRTLDRARDAAGDIAGLKRGARAPRTADLRTAVTRVTGEQGLASAISGLEVADGRVRLTFAAIEFARLVRLLDLLGRDEQLFAVEALVAARVEPGVVRAELALARP